MNNDLNWSDMLKELEVTRYRKNRKDKRRNSKNNVLKGNRRMLSKKMRDETLEK